MLDPAQLVRIQGTHRGFLYQHLYTAWCLLVAPETGVLQVRVERDEDIELVGESAVVYAQIKMRSSPLVPSDITGLVERHAKLRSTHHDGKRDGAALFALVASAELGPVLSRQTWLSDVVVATPSKPASILKGTGLQIPPNTVAALYSRACEVAEGYRLSALRPESLVAKLVGAIARAAAGERSSSFSTSELDDLCELVAAQLRPFPTVEDYIPQCTEPPLQGTREGVAIIGHSGEGKSAWAAQLAVHTSDVAVYVPCSSVAGDQTAARVVTAVAGTVVANSPELRAHDLVLPGRTGVDALALLHAKIESLSVPVTVVLDDCHNVPPDTLIAAMRAAPSFRWVVLGKPCEGIEEVTAKMDLRSCHLGGWSDDTVARLLADAGCTTHPNEVEALCSVTGGAPLLVLKAIEAVQRRNGDTGGYARELKDGETLERSPQEIILETSIGTLSAEHGPVASGVAAVHCGLRREEWVQVLSDAGVGTRGSIRQSLRVLMDRRFLQKSFEHTISVHDAFRSLLVDRFLTPTQSRSVLENARQLLREQLIGGGERYRIPAFLRILASLGRHGELADTANAVSEWIRETGAITEVRGLLETFGDDDAVDEKDWFWALDSLAFFDIEEGVISEAEHRIETMAALAERLDDDARDALAHKQLLIAVKKKDITSVRRLARRPAKGPRYGRIARYHAAIAEGEAGDVEIAFRQLLGLALEYLGELGLMPEHVLGKNPHELHSMMRSDADARDIQHLADCYDAVVRIARRNKIRQGPGKGLLTLWSMKFYELAGAPRSAIRAGQDLVEDMLRDLVDPEGAREFMEQNLLPASTRARMPELTVGVRAQYAVVCAHCGDFAAANEEMQSLAPLASGLTKARRSVIEQQRALVAELEALGPPSGEAIEARNRRRAEIDARADQLREAMFRPSDDTSRKVPRNASCPCGSGRKYKKCCGASS